MEDKIYDVAIIGGGPIGIFSIFACGIEGLSCAIFDSNLALGGQCLYQYAQKPIYDIPAYQSISGSDLVQKLVAQASLFPFDSFLNSFVSSIDFSDNLFTLNSASASVKAKSLILALGAGIYKPVKLSIPFLDSLEETHIFYNVDDLSRFTSKDVAVLGGGDSAVDWALEIAKVARTVYLVHRRDSFNCHLNSLQKILSTENIFLKAPCSLSKIELINERLLICGDSEFEVDFVLPFYGSSSNISFLKDWNLVLKNLKIEVDPASMQSSRQGIFAIGDCIAYPGKRNLILTGFSEAFVASRAIFRYIHPNKAFNVAYSTNLDLFK